MQIADNGQNNSAAQNNSLLRRAFCLCVLCLAIFQFSENTADPDLWGHVFFGRHFLETGTLMKTDPYSWTANGLEWINHEVIAEIALAFAQKTFGGTGLLLLKMIVGLLTFGIALSIAAKQMSKSVRIVAWAFGALAVVEISFGFAARPQIFSALALAAQFWILQQIHRGKFGWAFALPPLFAIWINTHGGVLAGELLLIATAVSPTLESLLKRFAPSKIQSRLNTELSSRIVIALWISTFAATAALLLNPWGFGLIRWLIESVSWLRPEIQEWNPTQLSWDHAAFFFCAIFAALAFCLSRLKISLWQIATTGLLFAMALRSERHTPLFCIAALSFAPPHLADVLQRFRQHFQRIESIGSQPKILKMLVAILIFVSAGILFATGRLHKEHAWTMEVPRAQYPVSAVQFIREHDLRGNLLVYFDWGEMCIWELPGSRVSLDGRLDTCYPREIINAHWNFYGNGDINGIDLQHADFALLPANLPCGAALIKSGWQPVYLDNLAVVLVKNLNQFPKLDGLPLPIRGDAQTTQGRAAFPASSP